MSKALKKLIDINRLREFKNKLIGAGSAYVQTGAVDQTVGGTKTFPKPIVGSVTGSSGSCTGNAATATKATQDSDGNQINTTYSKNGHTHDDRYYTEAEVNNLLAGKVNTSIGVYDIGSTILALTGTWVDYGHLTAGSGLRYAALNKNGGIYNLDISIGAPGTWIKTSGNSSETSGFGLYRRIA